MSIVDAFSDNFHVNIIGLISGSFGVVQFPDVPCNLARLKAHSSNLGSFFLATDPGVTAGWELDAGDDTGWMSVGNLNQFYYGRTSGSADQLDYWIQR